VIFAQLFEPVSSTYTYLLGCEETGLAVLIDPVMPAWQRDLAEVRSRGLTLAYTVDTHIHGCGRTDFQNGDARTRPALPRLHRSRRSR
jgi:hypothetical protein